VQKACASLIADSDDTATKVTRVMKVTEVYVYCGLRQGFAKFVARERNIIKKQRRSKAKVCFLGEHLEIEGC
jgi:hypothetical protein